jgi:hypothetical protein
MRVGMSWGALGHGQGWGEFHSVDDARAALWRAVVRTCSRVGVVRCDLLRRAGTVLQREMDTRGRRALEHGHKWSARYGSAWVALYPRGRAKHEKAPHRPEKGR